MSTAPKSLAAIAGAVAMVVGAVIGRTALENNKTQANLRFTVVCDVAAEAFCRTAAEADSRLTIRVESPEVTTKGLIGLLPGQAPDFQAWVSVGPWLAMADGRRNGQLPLQTAVKPVATTPVVFLTRLGQSLASCGQPNPAACLPLPKSQIGLPSPRKNGVGLAGLAQIVLARTGISANDLDRAAISSPPAADFIDNLSRATNASAGLEQLNVAFSQANPLVVTQAASAQTAGRAQVVRGEPSLRVVLEVALLDPKAAFTMTGGAVGRALARATIDAGWDEWQPGADATGGLPDPGVLAALQDAWTGP